MTSHSRVDQGIQPKQRQHRLTPGQVDRLVAVYESGLSISAVARAHHVDHQTAVNHLARRGVVLRPQKVVFTAEVMPELLALKAEGLSHRQIAERYGCSKQAVGMAMRRASKPDGTCTSNPALDQPGGDQF